jgi:protein O-GlcNAc transferase
VALWARVLRAIPGSRILVKTIQLDDPDQRERLYGEFEALGIGRSRVDVEGQSPQKDLLARYGSVDIGLDPFPYSGGLTTLEALWMGVPVVTLGGDRFAARHSRAHQECVGVREGIASGPDDYVARARALAQDLDRLEALRAGLRDRVRQSPLCDGPRFAVDLEAALRGMWREACARKAP